MAYVTESNVKSELSIDITTSTQPTAAETSEFIDQIEAEVTGVLNVARISTPISSTTSPNAYKIITQTALWGVCARVLAAYGGVVLDQTPKQNMYWDRYKAKLAEIKDNPNVLDDATYLTADSDLMVDGIVYGDDEYNNPFFTMDDTW